MKKTRKKIDLDKLVLDLGCAGLRCGRWYLHHKKEKGIIKPYGNANFYKGYHAAKYYAYFYVLSQLGLAEIIEPQKVKNYKAWLKKTRKGLVILFKGKFSVDILIGKELFKQILKHPNENWGKEIIKDIKKWSLQIK